MTFADKFLLGELCRCDNWDALRLQKCLWSGGFKDCGLHDKAAIRHLDRLAWQELSLMAFSTYSIPSVYTTDPVRLEKNYLIGERGKQKLKGFCCAPKCERDRTDSSEARLSDLVRFCADIFLLNHFLFIKIEVHRCISWISMNFMPRHKSSSLRIQRFTSLSSPSCFYPFASWHVYGQLLFLCICFNFMINEH